MTTTEKQILEIGQYLLQPLNDRLKVHCMENGIPFNPALEFRADTLQIVIGSLNGAAYRVHNDIDCFNCDDLTPEEEMAHIGHGRVMAADVQVLTVVLSSAGPEHDIDFKVFYPDHDTEVASMPSLGPLMATLQYLCLQLGKHEVTNGNCSLGNGFRIVISFRHLGPFQLDEAMVSLLLFSFCMLPNWQWNLQLTALSLLLLPAPPQTKCRLQKYGVSLEPHNWVTIDQYNKHSNGDPFQSGAVATSSSISSFPSTSSSLIGGCS